MPSCTFFGHRQCPDHITNAIESSVEMLIEYGLADTFYVGNQGGYDSSVLKVLRRMKEKYPHITYSVVLAYHPSVREVNFARPDETVLPEEVAACHPRFAIDKRNRWMLSKSDYAICYAWKTGGAMKFTELAIKQGIKVKNLAEDILSY